MSTVPEYPSTEQVHAADMPVIGRHGVNRQNSAFPPTVAANPTSLALACAKGLAKASAILGSEMFSNGKNLRTKKKFLRR